MHAAVRPYFTGGIALVGASVIAVSPIAPPLPDFHLPNPAQVAKEVELAAFVNPITTLTDVIQTAINNLSTTGGQVLADPFPVLQQIGVNQQGFATTLSTPAQGLANAIASSTLPASLQTALGQVAAGDIAGAVSTLNNALTTAGLGAVIPLLPVFAIPSQMAQNLLNVTNTLSTGGLPLALGLSVLSTVEGTAFQVGASAQAAVDAVQAGDGVTALSALLNGPAEITGAFLNGVPSQGFVGILSPSLGLANVLTVQIPKQIAAALALGAPTPAPALVKAAALTAPSELPSVAPKVVTLPTPAKVDVPADGSGPIAKLFAPTHTNKTTTADSTPATTADSTAATTTSSAGATTTSNAGSVKTKDEGNKVASGAVGAKGTKSGSGLARALSKIGGKHASRSGGHK